MIELIKNLLIGYSKFLIIVAVAILIDFITGITKAIYNKNIQSEKLRKTIPKIIGYFAIIIIGICIEIVFNIGYISAFIMLFIIVIEFLSTLENISNYVTIPKFLLKFLEDKKQILDDGGSNAAGPGLIPDINEFESEVNDND